MNRFDEGNVEIEDMFRKNRKHVCMFQIECRERYEKAYMIIGMGEKNLNRAK